MQISSASNATVTEDRILEDRIDLSSVTWYVVVVNMYMFMLYRRHNPLQKEKCLTKYELAWLPF